MSDVYIFDVEESNFESVVVENSHKLPVLVDFWAEWCQPCQSLIPVLHKIAADFAGQLVLAKVNSDEQQALVQQYGVRSLPTVKLFVNGEVVDEFTGALPESEILAKLDNYLQRESDAMLAAAVAEYEQGNIEAAIEHMREAAESDPDNPRVQTTYARVLLEHKQTDTLQAFIQNLPAEMRTLPEIAAIKAQLEILARLGNGMQAETLLARVEADPDDCEAREQLSAVYVSQGNYVAALEQLLEIMKRDRAYNEDAGRMGLLRLFEMLGPENPLTVEYRRKMSLLLF
ncbi:tetratricopeptide repeat protein [Sulfuriflexus sp.]|uniref:tetratricopeptide repeat protein n=1 Tax=Sulfuriflexus sp. TaxID=2015443 RepID=UPI0028CD7B39|nr:tetratricopeptide repeat protein [Sulfuriflexus sp.]MDT8403357.1 tetratricopeptide repeat protein [Sulfuriflexus sp.]